MAHIQEQANGAFLGQKKSGAGSALDAELAAESDQKSVEDPDQIVGSEALGARHRRRFGYSTEGAEEHDAKLLAQGHAPLKVVGHRATPGESRIAHFNHSIVMTRHPTTVTKAA